jgi:hypothetical protein
MLNHLEFFANAYWRLFAMSSLGIENKTPSRAMADRFESKIDEVMAFCPACKAFETVCLNGGKLDQNPS